MVAYIFFGLFAIAGLAAFIGSSYSPMTFWLQNGYWKDSPTQILFGVLFLVTHGGIGFGGLFYLWSQPDKKTALENNQPDKPWLSKTYWANPIIHSNTGTLVTILAYAFRYFVVISIITTFVVYESIKLKDYVGLLGLIAPAITVIIFLYINKLTQQQKQFGLMPLSLNPFPGSIGGQCGGSISTRLAHQSIKKSTVELQCVRYYTSGDDSREEILWNEHMAPAWKTTIDGQEMSFCFDLDSTLRAAQASEERPYIAWAIFVEITLQDGSIIKHEYEDIPVFNTQTQSTLRDQQAHAKHSIKTAKMHDTSLDQIMPFKSMPDGSYHINYPAGRSLLGLVGAAVGAIFIVSGLLIPDIIFNILFPLLGGLAFSAGVYSLVNSVDIHINPLEVHSKRYVFGFLASERKIPSYNIQEFITKKSISTSSSGKKIQYYDIYALSNDGQRALVVEGVKGMGQARSAIQRLNDMMSGK
ncbi:MAG: hypothetical protein ACRBEE_12135 [Arenicella sp.]